MRFLRNKDWNELLVGRFQLIRLIGTQDTYLFHGLQEVNFYTGGNHLVINVTRVRFPRPGVYLARTTFSPTIQDRDNTPHGVPIGYVSQFIWQGSRTDFIEQLTDRPRNLTGKRRPCSGKC